MGFRLLADYKSIYKGLHFKPSTLKKDRFMEFVATNLQQQTMSVFSRTDDDPAERGWVACPLYGSRMTTVDLSSVFLLVSGGRAV
jgi:hypothetical protein